MKRFGGVHMEEQRILQEDVVIALPDGFFEMTEADFKEKNILLRPEHMLTNGKEVYIIAETKARGEGDFIDNLKSIYTVTERITPGFYGLGMAKKEINGIEMGVIQYKSNTVVDNSYNIMMICNIKNKQIMVSGHCVWGDYEKWRPVFINMFETVEERGNEA